MKKQGGRQGLGPRLTQIQNAIADDPLLIGYRLSHISRLLATSGYRCDLAGSFSRASRYEIMHVVRGRPRSLAATTVMSGVIAVDEGCWIKRPHFRAILTNRFWKPGRRTGEPNVARLGMPKHRQRMMNGWVAACGS